VASLSQGRTAAAQCGLFTHKSVPVIFEPPCITTRQYVGMFIFTLLPFYPGVGVGGPYTIREPAGGAFRALLNLLGKRSQYFNRKMKGRNFEQNNRLCVA